MAAAAQGSTWKPYDSLTVAPTNLKEAIDWVLRVTGRDGKKNEAAQPQPPPASTTSGPHCLCYLAKAVKDLLYDAKDPGSPGPSHKRNWDDILLEQESAIVHPVLTDLGLVTSDSTTSTTHTCAGGTEVIKALIDQLALGLQKWVGWQEGGQDVCCLKGDSSSQQSKGIGGKCTCNGGGGAGCCTGGGASCTCNTGGKNCCYRSAYKRPDGAPGSSGSSSSTGDLFLWASISSDSTKVHLLARIFLGSVCLIWSGLSQLGFLTGGSGSGRWKDSNLHDIGKDKAGLGSFMAAMGYDLDRLNHGPGKAGTFVNRLLTNNNKDKNGIQWNEFYSVKNNTKDSVAEYYSIIYGSAKTAAKGKNTEEICKQYPLLVLHILASGYFRAGSAGANKVTPKAATGDTKKPRNPRTIREILYWLSALPYSEKYRELVERMDGKMKDILPKEKQESLTLEGTSGNNNGTTLKRDCVTHYLLAACGYCPLVLIGIQGTIEKEVKTDTGQTKAEPVRCDKHKEDRNHRCDPKNKKTQEASQQQQNNGELTEGQVCYGGYHLEVSKFGPLHGMYANGLYGFGMDGSAAQCLDQLRIYVYHCFYQLYFLRKQCKEGVVENKTVLGWKSCRYGSGVYWGSGYNAKNLWRCQTDGSEHTQKCGIGSAAGSNVASGTQISPLMCFLCDGVDGLVCGETKGMGVESYPEIEKHYDAKESVSRHLGEPPMHCPVPMGFQSGRGKEEHFKDLNKTHKTLELQDDKEKYPVHCTGNTLSHLLEYYCGPEQCHGTLVVLLRLLACITPTVPRTLGDLFGFYYYVVYIGGNKGGGGVGPKAVHDALGIYEKESKLYMLSIGSDGVVEALKKYGENCSGGTAGNLKCLYSDGKNNCTPFLSPLSGQQYGQLSPVLAGTYLSWLVYLIGEFNTGVS